MFNFDVSIDVSKCFKLRHWQALRMPNMSCHAEEVLEANRALQVMRGREQLLRFARPRLPIQNPADVHQLFS